MSRCGKCGWYPEAWDGREITERIRTCRHDWNAEPSLRLLVVDFGESCAVYVEKKDSEDAITFSPPSPIVGVYSLEEEGELHSIPESFDYIRKSIDSHFTESDRPVPRIEKNEKGFGLFTHNACNWFLQKEHYNAFNELARAAGAPRDLPIYEPRGTWTQVLGGIGKDAFNDVADIAIWIYER